MSWPRAIFLGAAHFQRVYGEAQWMEKASDHAPVFATFDL